MVDTVEIGRLRAAGDVVPAVEAAPRPDSSGGIHVSLAAALAASSALVACGGGGGGGGGGGLFGAPAASSAPASGTVQAGSLTALNNTATASTFIYTQAKTDAEAARFLLQAQFSASDADIAAVRAKGYLPWLGEQMDMAPTQTGWDWLNSKAAGTANVDSMIWQQLMKSGDAVRKRMALVFTEIFVVSANDIGSNWPDLMMAGYWDMMVAGVTTNFRKLIEDVTLNPAMGFYLNTRGNQKENNNGRQPDENYGREVMQLMTLGLVQLNPDGTPKAGADGAPLDSYTQDDVTNIARVFTGYDLDIRANERNFTPPGANYTIDNSAWTRRPMVLTASNHSTLAANFLGANVPDGTPGAQALKIALDTLAAHPNTAPFICKQVIQRLVTSNPSPAYVARVAAVFVDNGAGVRGDMKSVFAAVLLDNEARSPAGLTDPNFGRLREPMLRFVQWGRTFGIQSTLDTWAIGARTDAGSNGLGQSPLRSPSVFNFFRPGYVPPSTAMAAAKLVAPEFQLVNETSVGGYLNFMQNILQNGFNNKDVVATYTVEKTLVLDPPALVARLNLLMTGNELSAGTVALIVGALAQPAVTAGSTDAVKLNRVTAAVLLVLASAEYLIQK